MADEVIAPNQAPAVETTAAQPSASGAPAQSAEAVPAASASGFDTVLSTDSTKIPEDAKPQPEATAPEDKGVETVLSTDKPEKKEDAKPAEVKPEEKPAEQEDESSQSDEPAPLPTYEPFNLPEGADLNGKELAEFTKDLGEFESANKVDHTTMQGFGQKLVDRYVAEVSQLSKRINEAYSKQWEKQNNDWAESFKNDPEIGKNRMETTKTKVIDAVGDYAGNADQLKEFKSFMKYTGVGNHPSLIRLISNMQDRISSLQTKYESEKDVKQLAATKPAAPKSKQPVYKKFYGNMN